MANSTLIKSEAMLRYPWGVDKDGKDIIHEWSAGELTTDASDEDVLTFLSLCSAVVAAEGIDCYKEETFELTAEV